MRALATTGPQIIVNLLTYAVAQMEKMQKFLLPYITILYLFHLLITGFQ